MKDKFYTFFSFVREYALYGLLFFIPISVSLIEVFAALMILGFIGRKIIRPDFNFIKFWPNAVLFSFLLFSALSLFNSGAYLNISLHALFGKWMKYLAICVIIQDIACDPKIIKRAIFVFLSSALVTVLSGLSQYYFGIEFLRHRSIAVTIDGMAQAATSSFAHYNGFGGYLVAVLALTSALLMANNPFNIKTICLSVLSMFSIVAVLLTFSRGSWLAIFISLIFIFIFSRKHFARIILFFLVAIVVCLLSSYIIKIGAPSSSGPVSIGSKADGNKIHTASVLSERMLLTFKSGGDSDRFRYWLAASKMIRKHPFLGLGLGTFMANFQNYILLKDAYAHNCYLQIWAETGVFSLISFVVFVSSLVYLGVKKFLDSRDYLLLGLLSGFVGFLVRNFLDTDLYSLQLAVLFWIWAGLISARARD